MSNFWRSLDLPMINCKIELDLTRSEDYIISEILTDIEVPASIAANPSIARTSSKRIYNRCNIWNNHIEIINQIIIIVTLSLNDNINFLENIKLRFKRISFWNKFRSEISTLTKGKNFNYMIDMTLRNINRLFFIQKWWQWSWNILFW